MTWENTFKGFIRVVFLFAYGAFLWASLHHIAYFFHSFEQDSNNWGGSYALAISIDVTALVLTIGVMFFRKGMAIHSLVFVWIFIFSLTGFSWLVNWEYAIQFQGAGLNKAIGLQDINPILASAFAFLNLAYSVIAEFFNDKPKSLAELEAELTRVQGIKRIQDQLKEAKKGTGFIATLTEKTKEVLEARREIFGSQNRLQEVLIMPASLPVEEEQNDVLLDPITITRSPDETPIEELDESLDMGNAFVLEQYPMIALWLSKGRKSATLEELCEATHKSDKILKNRIAKGVIKSPTRNRNLYLIDSVIEWIKQEAKTGNKDKITQELPALKLVKKA